MAAVLLQGSLGCNRKSIFLKRRDCEILCDIMDHARPNPEKKCTPDMP